MNISVFTERIWDCLKPQRVVQRGYKVWPKRCELRLATQIFERSGKEEALADRFFVAVPPLVSLGVSATELLL